MERKYPGDLTDRQWQLVKRLVAEGVEKAKNIRDQIRSGADIYSLGKIPGRSRGIYFKNEVQVLLENGLRRRFDRIIHVPDFGDTKLYRWVKP